MIKETKYEKHGFRVTRQAETETGFIGYEVFPTKIDPAGIYAQKGSIAIPNYPRCESDRAEAVARAITLCVQAVRELQTGMRKTCLDQ